MTDIGSVRVAIAPDDGVLPVEAMMSVPPLRRASIDAADVLIWNHPSRADELAGALANAPHVRWVHLVFSGTEQLQDAITPGRIWTTGRSAFALPVAEHALALLLGCFRRLGQCSREGADAVPGGQMLSDRPITVVGGGRIAEEFVRLVAPFGGERLVVRRDARRPVRGATRVVGLDELDAVLGAADVVVLALALTPSSVGVIDRQRLDAMRPGSTLINVARGRHVITDDLVAALQSGHVGAAGLDVTDPEPLARDHPLRRMDNVIITPHAAATRAAAHGRVAAWLTRNLAAFAQGNDPEDRIEPTYLS